MAVCIGCGLETAANGDLIVSTSGVFDDVSNPDARPATCTSVNGSVVYCDENGDLRGPPNRATISESNGACVDLNMAPPAGTFIPITGAVLTLTNPSPCLNMVLDLQPTTTLAVFFGQTGFVVRRQLSVNGGAFTDAAIRDFNLNPGNGFDLEITQPEIMTLAPGATVTVQQRLSIDVGAPGGDSFISRACSSLLVYGHSIQ